MNTTRRDVLTSLAAAGSAALFPNLAVAQRGADNTRRIDVHHHFTPDVYTAYQAATGRGGRGGAGAAGGGRGRGRGAAGGAAATSAFPTWSLSQDLEDMDKNGTATAILSITTPGFPTGTTNEIRKAMRDCNEAAAKMRADRPGR